MSRRGRDRASGARYAFVLLVPLGFGAAIAFLSGAVHAPTGGAAGGPLSATTIVTVMAAVFVGLIALMVVVRVAQFREGTQSSAYVLRIVATWSVCLLLGVAFVILLRAAVPGGFGGLLPPSGTPTGTPGNHTPPPNASPSGPPLTAGYSSTIPGWIWYVFIGAIASVAGALAVPFWIARREMAESSPGPPPTPGRSVLEEALRDLDSAPSTDARTQVIAVYGHLLARVAGREGDLSSRTPREIQWICRHRLGVGERSAADITGLFEEARYSSHALDGGIVERARAALRSALADLDRTGRPAPP
ncbi:MAG TPA: DUF4129 domain-containing protein [Thermoplasmata archaeon]|nr:DUF4129 domain-containing protein [Thermoplasmata archaeon]